MIGSWSFSLSIKSTVPLDTSNFQQQSPTEPFLSSLLGTALNRAKGEEEPSPGSCTSLHPLGSFPHPRPLLAAPIHPSHSPIATKGMCWALNSPGMPPATRLP